VSIFSGGRWRRAFEQSAVAIVLTRLTLIGVGTATLTWHPFGIDANAASPLGRPDTPALLEMWARWDGEWYLDIATRGYSAPLPSGQFDMRPNFFPAFPAAITLLTVVVRHPALAAILISNAALLLALACLHAWTTERLSGAAADRVVWLYAVFPTSFFLSAAYAESLLLFGIIGAWLAAERNRWTLSGLFLMLAVLTKPIAVFAVAALFLRAARECRRSPSSLRKLAPALLLPVLGGVAYLVFADAVFGNALEVMRTQSLARSPMNWPWHPFVRAYAEGLYWHSYDLNITDGVAAFAAILCLPWVFHRLGIPEGALAAGVVLFPLTSGFVSFTRLLLPAFPIFVLPAAVLGRRGFVLVAVTAFILQAVAFAWFVGRGWIA
jgi:hypothetical protein